MRIEKIQYNYLPFCSKNPVNKNTAECKQINELSNAYYYPVKLLHADFNKTLENLKNIHCPVCGRKMITPEEKDKLLEKADKVKNSEDFLNFFNQNKDILNPEVYAVFEYLSSVIKQNPNIEPDELVFIIWNSAIQRCKKSIVQSVNYLNNLEKAEDFSNNDKELIEECKTKLIDSFGGNKKMFYKDYKKILSDTIVNMESDKKWGIYKKLKNDALDRFILKALITFENSDMENYYQLFIKKLINNAVRLIIPLNNRSNKYNNVLICNGCASKNTNITVTLFPTNDSRKQHFKNYINDLINAANQGKLKHYTGFPYVFTKVMNKISKGEYQEYFDSIFENSGNSLSD